MVDYSKLINNVKSDIIDLSFYNNKVIMVAGAGGSIGSEVCRQLLKHNPKQIVLFGRNENNLFHLNNELNSNKVVVKVGSITDYHPLLDVVKKYKPDVVVHAAANKHVPLCETNIFEAFKNNLLGTYQLYNVVNDNNVKHFVFISTDKACNPKSIMGLTKRLCEILLLTTSKFINSQMNCSVVRFGNVLGSSGSVVPIFQKQIEQKKPITITDVNMSRYFMTIPDASHLVLLSAILTNEKCDNVKVGKYMLDMGEQIKIIDLAKRLIKLNGLKPYKDINIIETGIRPGEKISEELAEDYNLVKPTRFNKVLSIPEDYNIQCLNDIIGIINSMTSFHGALSEDEIVLRAKNILKYIDK